MHRHRRESSDHLLLRGLPPAAAAVALLFAFSLPRAGDAGGNAGQPTMRTGRLTGPVAVRPELSSRRPRFNLHPDLVQPAGAARPPPPEPEIRNGGIFPATRPPGGRAA